MVNGKFTLAFIYFGFSRGPAQLIVFSLRVNSSLHTVYKIYLPGNGETGETCWQQYLD